MNKPRRTTDLMIVTAYLALVALLFYFEFTFPLSMLTIPWSIPLMMFSGLIVHITVDGKEQIMFGFIVGAILNSLLFLLARRRS